VDDSVGDQGPTGECLSKQENEMTRSKKKIVVGLTLFAVAWGSVVLGRRAPVLSGDAPSYRQMGFPRARVVLTEYSDLQCPKCGAAVPLIKDLLKAYPHDLRVVFHHAPLKQHKWAVLAAQASEAAGLQGKFWEYAELLFAKQTEWSSVVETKPLFLGYAKELDLDMDQFARDFESPYVVEMIQNEKARAESIEIPATPTFIINGRMLVGDTQLAGNGARYIERELGR
jgi:protein-disulfide isomerase